MRWSVRGVVESACEGGRSFIVRVHGGGVWQRNERFMKKRMPASEEAGEAQPVAAAKGPITRSRAAAADRGDRRA